MKVLQPKLSIGNEGKILIDSTNVKSNSVSKSTKKRKHDNNENLQPSKVKRTDGIYTDPPCTQTKVQKSIDASTQTDVKSCIHSQNIIDMLTSEETPSEYWEALAEKRRFALEVALEENQELKEENELLKGENKILEEMLEEAKQLATLVQEITDAEESSKTSFNKEESSEKSEERTESEMNNDPHQ
ncbi:UNVERIFIED_CONTAM: hypothetical protein RMT77_001517 [Armadillidium vulgare]